MTLRDDPKLAKTYAGILAASNAVVSKMDTGRPPQLAPHPPGFRPASLPEVPRLLAEANQIHRAAAAALCHAFETPPGKGVLSGGLAEKIWRNGAAKTRLDNSLLQVSGRSRDLFAQLLNSSVAVVTPDVQIKSEFGQEGSNISSAEIKDYKLLLSEESAIQVLGRSHPLNWRQGAPDLFKSVVPAKLEGKKRHQRWVRDPGRSPTDWQDVATREGVEYIYETAVWPWSEDVTLGVENVLRISGLKSSKPGARVKVLDYRYTLERCIRSDYGVIEEELSGMDIDDGEVHGRAVPLAEVTEHDAGTLSVADLRRLATKPGLESKVVPQRLAEDDAAGKAQLGMDFLRTIQQQGRDNLWLLTISSSKRLRYTVPQYAPADLWASLTWMAPALLYTFIDRAVCQLPQFVEQEIRDRKLLKLTQGTEL